MVNKCLNISLMLLYVITLAIYTNFVSVIDMTTMQAMGIFGVILALLCAYTWKREGKDLISPYFFFVVTLFIFLYGQSLLYAINIISDDRHLIGFQGISIYQVYRAQKTTLIMLAAFHIGALCVKNKTLVTADYKEKNICLREQQLQLIKKIGIFLFLISGYFYLHTLVANMILSIKFGYGALYDGEGAVGVAQTGRYLGDYFLPSIICLFIAYQNNKRKIKAIYGLCSLIIIAILLTGGRTYAVILILMLVLLRHYVIKRFSNREMIGLCVAGLFLLSVLAVVGKVRTSDNRSLESYTTTNDNNNAAVEAIAEMGSTMFCLIETQLLVPSTEDYRYGRSYLYSFTSLIPNLGFWEMHPARIEANLSDWLTDKLHLSYGTGFSMCAEAYANFGSYGWIMMFLLGLMLRKMLDSIDVNDPQRDLPLLVFSFIMFWFCLKMPRNCFLSTVRAFFYYALPVYLYLNIKIRQYIK